MCDICNGLPNCPVCSEENKKVTCPCCLGDGELRYNELGEQDKDGEIIDDCEECSGTGSIEI